MTHDRRPSRPAPAPAAEAASGAPAGAARLDARTAHDLQNKIGSIILNVDYMLSGEGSLTDQEAREILTDIRVAAEAVRHRLEALSRGGA